MPKQLNTNDIVIVLNNPTRIVIKNIYIYIILILFLYYVI